MSYQKIKSPAELLLLEEFCVIIKLPSQVNNLKLTYSKKVGGRLCQIDEMDAAERTITSCTFKGRSAIGNCPQDIKDIKQLLGSIKPKEWAINVDNYVDSFPIQFTDMKNNFKINQVFANFLE